MTVRDLIREAGAEMPGKGCRPEIEERLRAEFRRTRPRRALWPIWTFAAVAAAAIVAVVMIPKEKSQMNNRTVTTAKRAAAVEKRFENPVEAVASTIPVRPRASRPRARRAIAEPQPTEIRTQFYALDPAVIGAPVEGLLMRVRVPRATMASFGLPVNWQRLDQGVDADVLLGDNGAAQAIRFVRQVE